MTGRLAVIGLLVVGLIASAAIWFLQNFVEYKRFDGAQQYFGPILNIPGHEKEILMTEIEGIYGDSSPLKFRACFKINLSDLPQPEITSTYANPIPITAPDWFGCYDAVEIGADIELGIVKAYLVEKNIATGVDLIAAFYPDGRGFVWRQINTN